MIPRKGLNQRGSGVGSGAGRGFVSLDKDRVDQGTEKEVGTQGRRGVDLVLIFSLFSNNP